MAELSASTTTDEIVEPLDDSSINRRLRAQYAEIARLAGGLAHEIKNPLSTMSLNLDLLVEDFQGAETTRDKRVLQKLERVRKETERLNDIVEDFLRFAKVQDIRPEPSDLNAVVDDLRDFCEPQAMCQGIVIRTQYDPDLPLVPLDVDLFKQALWNLVRNAHHAMPEGGELILQTRLEGDSAILDVTDTGVGMTQDVAAQVFDAFYSTKASGSGLGLPTTRKIVEAHGGSIALQSEPGQGSRFIVRLPLEGT
jgi:two-component system, NtrC family, sensor histidine kinase HydH